MRGRFALPHTRAHTQPHTQRHTRRSSHRALLAEHSHHSGTAAQLGSVTAAATRASNGRGSTCRPPSRAGAPATPSRRPSRCRAASAGDLVVKHHRVVHFETRNNASEQPYRKGLVDIVVVILFNRDAIRLLVSHRLNIRRVVSSRGRRARCCRCGPSRSRCGSRR